MADVGLSSGTDFLRDAARKFFRDVFENPTIAFNAEIDRSLQWKPSLSFKQNNHLMVLAETSETPYPLIFNLRRVDVLKLNIPISIYCVCPEEAYLKEQASAKELIAHGYGLLTVATDGTVTRRASCIPLVQQITDQEFKTEIGGLPSALRRRLAEAFERYKQNPQSGVTDITEVFEGQVLRAGREASKKGLIATSQAKAGKPANTLAAMLAVKQFKNATAAIGGAQNYISVYRNMAHHFPKDRKQALKKYRDCRHGFLDGLKKVQEFHQAMKHCGLSGAL